MSKPAPGKYYILNRVNSLTGKVLAITYAGEGAVIAAEYKKLPTQVWIISNFKDGRTQRVFPQGATNLEIGWEGGQSGSLRIVPYNENVWAIRKTQGLTTIQDAGAIVFWGLQKAVDKETVSYGHGTGDEKQNWLFIPA